MSMFHLSSLYGLEFYFIEYTFLNRYKIPGGDKPNELPLKVSQLCIEIYSSFHKN